MGTQVDQAEDLNEEAQVDESEQAEGEQTEGETPEGEQDTENEGDSVVVTIGDEAVPFEEDEFEGRPAPKWVKELRIQNRELSRENRELKAAKAATSATEQAVTVGEKPTLEACDFDTERFERDLTAWHERKRKTDDEEMKKRKAQEDAQAAWNAKVASYEKGKTELKVKDYADAEDTVKESLNITQQGIILTGADNPALLVYALGKNSKKAKELASIGDPVKFAFAVAKLETQLKVTPRKAAPLPEKSIRGSAPVSGAVDSTLERLRAEAEKTGDYTKVTQYKRKQCEKQ